MNRKYFMIRAMDSREDDFREFFGNNVVAVGWSQVDLSNPSKSVEEIIREADEVYYADTDIAPQVRGKKLNEIRRFLSIKDGDFLIIPYYGSIRLAVAKSRFTHKDEPSTISLDLANQLEVQYVASSSSELRTIPRAALSEGLQRRLRVRGSTVSDLSEFGKEIEQIFSEENYSWTTALQAEIEKRNNETKKKLLANIQQGKTNLKTGGIGLENLVKELLILEGYDAQVLSKKTFDGFGDADVLATKSDRFQETRILIQVKHHAGYSDDWGIQQLREIKSGEAYREHTLGFITTANVGEEVRALGDKEGIIVMDGEEFVDWLFEKIDALDEKILLKLGVNHLPMIIS